MFYCMFNKTWYSANDDSNPGALISMSVGYQRSYLNVCYKQIPNLQLLVELLDIPVSKFRLVSLLHERISDIYLFICRIGLDK